ncbi:hypothetical protein MRX96_009032 [Rhipicephalus microplus]
MRPEPTTTLLHETLCVAVIEEVAAALHPDLSYPPEFKKMILWTFLESCNTYLHTARLQIRRMVREGRDPFGGRTTRFDYDFILIRLDFLHDSVSELCRSRFLDWEFD